MRSPPFSSRMWGGGAVLCFRADVVFFGTSHSITSRADTERRSGSSMDSSVSTCSSSSLMPSSMDSMAFLTASLSTLPFLYFRKYFSAFREAVRFSSRGTRRGSPVSQSCSSTALARGGTRSPAARSRLPIFRNSFPRSERQIWFSRPSLCRFLLLISLSRAFFTPERMRSLCPRK